MSYQTQVQCAVGLFFMIYLLLEDVTQHQRKRTCFMCSVHVQWGNISQAPHYRTVPEPDLRITVDSTWKPSQLVCRVPVVNPMQL